MKKGYSKTPAGEIILDKDVFGYIRIKGRLYDQPVKGGTYIRYMGYTEKDAIKAWRREFGAVGLKLEVIKLY